MKGGLALVFGPKAKAKEDEDYDKDDEAGGSEKELARLAVQSIQEGDEEAATSALLGAIKACVAKAKSGGYAPEE